MQILKNTLEKIDRVDDRARLEAKNKLDGLIKPFGSLGKLEDLVIKLAGISSSLEMELDKKAVVTFCSDNGVLEEGVSGSPKEFTMILAENTVEGRTGVAVLSEKVGADNYVVDVGMELDIKNQKIIDRKIRKSTDNFAKGPSMSYEEAIKAIEIGIEIGDRLFEKGYNILGTGELGMGNTTTSSAILAVLTDLDLDLITGKGAGLTDQQYENKKATIKKGIELNKPDKRDPIDLLAKLGGFDIASICGLFLSCGKNKIPVVVDGFISTVAGLLAKDLNKNVVDYMIPSHMSNEPGARYALDLLGLEAFWT